MVVLYHAFKLSVRYVTQPPGPETNNDRDDEGYEAKGTNPTRTTSVPETTPKLVIVPLAVASDCLH
jgi:hypothetical protein